MTGNLPSRDHRTRKPKSSSTSTKAPAKWRRRRQKAPAARGKRVPVSPELPVGDHNYTAVATEASPLGNPEGKSNTVSFTVNTEPPKVELNPASVEQESNDRTPSFKGTASASTEVVVRVSNARHHRSRESRHSRNRRCVVHRTCHPRTARRQALVHRRRVPDVPDRQRGRQEHRGPVHRQHRTAEGRTEGRIRRKTFQQQEAGVLGYLEHARTRSRRPHLRRSDGSRENDGKGQRRQLEDGCAVAGTPDSGTTPTLRPRRRQPAQKSGREEQDGPVRRGHRTARSEAHRAGRSSSDKTPSFSGTSSEPGVVTVSVYAGSTAEGEPGGPPRAKTRKGQWITGAVDELKYGTYTAVATEPSAIGNSPGVSKPGGLQG